MSASKGETDCWRDPQITEWIEQVRSSRSGATARGGRGWERFSIHVMPGRLLGEVFTHVMPGQLSGAGATPEELDAVADAAGVRIVTACLSLSLPSSAVYLTSSSPLPWKRAREMLQRAREMLTMVSFSESV